MRLQPTASLAALASRRLKRVPLGAGGQDDPTHIIQPKDLVAARIVLVVYCAAAGANHRSRK